MTAFVASSLTLYRTFASSKQSLDDLNEQHGPPRIFSTDNLPSNAEALAEALESGEIDETDLDVLVDDLLLLMERTGVLDGVGGEPEKPLDRPEDRALNRRAAAAGSRPKGPLCKNWSIRTHRGCCSPSTPRQRRRSP